VRRPTLFVPLLVAGCLIAPAARADDPRDACALRVSWPADISITASGAALWIGSQLLQPQLAPSSCRLCDTSLGGIDRGVKVSFRWNNTKLADTLSNVTAFGLTPVAMFGLQAWIDLANGSKYIDWAKDALILTETVVVAMDVNQLVKFIAGRQRPFVNDPGPGDPGPPAHPADNNVSFFSGHTTSVFAFAVGAGTIASLRGYRAAPAIWITGITLASLTGYLRIAADRHYFTDVATGALFGSAVGVLVPYLHRPCAGISACVNGVTVAPVKSGAGLGVYGVF
jgi:membrane-associated phospholipid phosphatase